MNFVLFPHSCEEILFQFDAQKRSGSVSERIVDVETEVRLSIQSNSFFFKKNISAALNKSEREFEHLGKFK
jgi:hypothetical protein